MKNWKKMWAILLAVCMAFSLMACSAGGDQGGDASTEDSKVTDKTEQKLSDEELIVGTWETKLVFGDYMDQFMNMDEAPEGVDLSVFEDMKLTLEVTFAEDGEGTASVDTKAFAKDMKKIMVTLMEDMLEEQLTAELGMSVEEIEAEYGMSFDELVEQTLGASVEDTVDKLIDDMMENNEDFKKMEEKSFEYEIKKNKLYIDGEKKDYEFEDEDTLTLTGETDAGDEVEFSFERVD